MKPPYTEIPDDNTDTECPFSKCRNNDNGWCDNPKKGKEDYFSTCHHMSEKGLLRILNKANSGIRIGNKRIQKCGECPAYKWNGESLSRGDCGCRCDFGAFHTNYDEIKTIPDNCPLLKLINESERK